MVAPAIAASQASSKATTSKAGTTAGTAQSESKAVATDPAPSTVSPGHPASGYPPANPEPKKAAPPEKKIDLNSASIAELKTIPGVGDAEAKKIIANRPYTSKTELVTKAGLPDGIYVSARHRVEARPVKQGATKKTPSTTQAGTSAAPQAAKAAPAKSESPKSETKQ